MLMGSQSHDKTVLGILVSLGDLVRKPFVWQEIEMGDCLILLPEVSADEPLS